MYPNSLYPYFFIARIIFLTARSEFPHSISQSYNAIWVQSKNSGSDENSSFIWRIFLHIFFASQYLFKFRLVTKRSDSALALVWTYFAGSWCKTVSALKNCSWSKWYWAIAIRLFGFGCRKNAVLNIWIKAFASYSGYSKYKNHARLLIVILDG